MLLDLDNFPISHSADSQNYNTSLGNWSYINHQKVYLEFFQNLKRTCHQHTIIHRC